MLIFGGRVGPLRMQLVVHKLCNNNVTLLEKAESILQARFMSETFLFRECPKKGHQFVLPKSYQKAKSSNTQNEGQSMSSFRDYFCAH